MEVLSELVGLDQSIYKTVDEQVDESVIINRVFRGATHKVAQVLFVSVHVTLTLFEPQECKRALDSARGGSNVSLFRDFKVSND
uniref:Uncharacterized protein n=1 Tax=Peronospora matthiolae TaxID=2874970 RepID=A0AAV1VBI4_9STRA